MSNEAEEPYPAADYDHDFPFHSRRVYLAEALKDLDVSEEACDSLHSWMYPISADRRMRRALAHAIPKEAVAIQIDECRKLMRAAQKVADRMSSWARLAPAGQALEASYGSVLSKSEEGPFEPWESFAAAVARDAALLARVAKTAAEELVPKKRRTGPKRKSERDILFAEWFEKLREATDKGVEHIFAPAVASWNCYFPEDKFEKVDTVKKARFRGKAASKRGRPVGK